MYEFLSHFYIIKSAISHKSQAQYHTSAVFFKNKLILCCIFDTILSDFVTYKACKAFDLVHCHLLESESSMIKNNEVLRYVMCNKYWNIPLKIWILNFYFMVTKICLTPDAWSERYISFGWWYMCAVCCGVFSIISFTGIFLAVAWCNGILLWVLLVLSVCVCVYFAARQILLMHPLPWAVNWAMITVVPKPQTVSQVVTIWRWNQTELFHSVLLGLSYGSKTQHIWSLIASTFHLSHTVDQISIWELL